MTTLHRKIRFLIVEDDQPENPRRGLRDLHLWGTDLIEVDQVDTFTDGFMRMAYGEYDFFFLDTHLAFGDRDVSYRGYSFHGTWLQVRDRLPPESRKLLESADTSSSIHEGGLLLRFIRSLASSGKRGVFVHYSADPTMIDRLYYLKRYGAAAKPEASATGEVDFAADKMVAAEVLEPRLWEWAEKTLREERPAIGACAEEVRKACADVEAYAGREKVDREIIHWLSNEGGSSLGTLIEIPLTFGASEERAHWRFGYLWPHVGALMRYLIQQAQTEQNAILSELRRLRDHLAYIDQFLAAYSRGKYARLWFFFDAPSIVHRSSYGISTFTHPSEKSDAFVKLGARDMERLEAQLPAVLETIRTPEGRDSLQSFVQICAAVVRRRGRDGDVYIDPAGSFGIWFEKFLRFIEVEEGDGNLAKILGDLPQPELVDVYMGKTAPAGGSSRLDWLQRQCNRPMSALLTETMKALPLSDLDRTYGDYANKPELLRVLRVLTEAFKYRWRLHALDLKLSFPGNEQTLTAPEDNPVRGYYCEKGILLKILKQSFENLATHQGSPKVGSYLWPPMPPDAGGKLAWARKMRWLVVDLHVQGHLEGKSRWEAIFSPGAGGYLAQLRDMFQGLGDWFALDIGGSGGECVVAKLEDIEEDLRKVLPLEEGCHHLFCLPIPASEATEEAK